MATRNITPPTTPPAMAPLFLLFLKLPELARSVAWLAPRDAVACEAVVEVSAPWGIVLVVTVLIGGAEELESEAVVPVIDNEAAVDVVEDATGVNVAAGVDCGWADVARAWAELRSYLGFAYL